MEIVLKRSLLIVLATVFLSLFAASCGDGDTGNTGDTGDTGNTGNTGNTENFPHNYNGLKWSDKSEYVMDYNYAKTYCRDLGGKLPNISELRSLIQNCGGTEVNGPCGVSETCSTADCMTTCGGCAAENVGTYSVFGDTEQLWSDTSMDKDIGWTVNFLNASVVGSPKNIDLFTRCTTCVCGGRECGDDGCGNSCGTCGDDMLCNDSGKCIDISESFPRKHDGKFWSTPSSEEMSWDAAKDYCASLDGRLPTISELRTLVINCPAIATGGECTITDDCLDSVSCDMEDCLGCFSDTSTETFSVFGDQIPIWSSSENTAKPEERYWIGFSKGFLMTGLKTGNLFAICTI